MNISTNDVLSKAFTIEMYNLPLAPLNGTNPPGPHEPAHGCDNEMDAIEFARSISSKWDRVRVRRTSDRSEIVCFHNDDEYVDGKRITPKMKGKNT